MATARALGTSVAMNGWLADSDMAQQRPAGPGAAARQPGGYHCSEPDGNAGPASVAVLVTSNRPSYLQGSPLRKKLISKVLGTVYEYYEELDYLTRLVTVTCQ